MKGNLIINTQFLNHFLFAIIRINILKFKCIMLFVFTKTDIFGVRDHVIFKEPIDSFFIRRAIMIPQIYLNCGM